MGFPQVHQPGWADQPAPAGAPADDTASAFTVGEQGPEIPPAKPKRRRAQQTAGQDTPES